MNVRTKLNKLRRIVQRVNNLTKNNRKSHRLLDLSQSDYCFLARDVTNKSRRYPSVNKKQALHQMRFALELAADHLVDHINYANPNDVSINVVQGSDLQDMSEWTGVPKNVIEYLLCGNVQKAHTHTIPLVNGYKDEDMREIAICVRKPIRDSNRKPKIKRGK